MPGANSATPSLISHQYSLHPARTLPRSAILRIRPTTDTGSGALPKAPPPLPHDHHTTIYTRSHSASSTSSLLSTTHTHLHNTIYKHSTCHTIHTTPVMPWKRQGHCTSSTRTSYQPENFEDNLFLLFRTNRLSLYSSLLFFWKIWMLIE